MGASQQWIPGDVGAALAEAIRWPAIGGKLEEAKLKKQETSPWLFRLYRGLYYPIIRGF